MVRKELSVVVANKGPIIGPTGFRNYDIMLNSYVGCQMGCAYCYVRWLVKDDNNAWGDFVRVRKHLEDKLPKELQRGYFKIPVSKKPKVKDGEPVMKNGKQVKETIYKTVLQENARLVIGTLTDPYQPQERKHRITRSALQALLKASPQLNKIGIFTRSPIILDDLDLIVQLPRKRVHFTVTPYTPDVLHLIEPIAIRTDRRFDTIRKLKAAGVRVHVNVAPAIPIISERFTEEFADILADIQVDQWYADPMETYKESWEALEKALKHHQDWPAIKEIMSDKEKYADWKAKYRQTWKDAWDKVQHKAPDCLPIWSDHITKEWIDLRTGKQMDLKRHGDDIEPNTEQPEIIQTEEADE